MMSQQEIMMPFESVLINNKFECTILHLSMYTYIVWISTKDNVNHIYKLLQEPSQNTITHHHHHHEPKNPLQCLNALQTLLTRAMSKPVLHLVTVLSTANHNHTFTSKFEKLHTRQPRPHLNSVLLKQVIRCQVKRITTQSGEWVQMQVKKTKMLISQPIPESWIGHSEACLRYCGCSGLVGNSQVTQRSEEICSKERMRPMHTTP